MTNVSYSYQWIRNDGSADTDIQDAAGSGYTLVDADEGKTIKVKVSFTDDAGNEESLTSAATASVAGAPEPITVILENNPASHNGTDEFTFQIRFSEHFKLSYKTLRDHAFTVVGGTVKKAQRQVKGSNIGWTITVEPTSNAEVEIVLPATTDCDATGAICTADGRKLSQLAGLHRSGPGRVKSDSRLRPRFLGNEKTLCTWKRGRHGTAEEHHVSACRRDTPSRSPLLVSAAYCSVPTSSLSSSRNPLSETPRKRFSHETLRDHAFTVTDGEISEARRLEKFKNVRWEITVRPDSSGTVTIVLPATTDCTAEGAICTQDGRKLSNRLEITVQGPAG